jgi:hypothetical protein
MLWGLFSVVFRRTAGDVGMRMRLTVNCLASGMTKGERSSFNLFKSQQDDWKSSKSSHKLDSRPRIHHHPVPSHETRKSSGFPSSFSVSFILFGTANMKRELHFKDIGRFRPLVSYIFMERKEKDRKHKFVA